MMEMLVVFILIAVLAQVAIVTYRNSIQDSKLDHAKAVLQEIGIAAQRFYTDYPAVRLHTAVISNPADTDACKVDKFGGTNPEPWMLIACGYLEKRNWANFDYEFHVCGDQTGECTGVVLPDGTPGTLAYMVALPGAGKYYDTKTNTGSVFHYYTGQPIQ